MILSSPALSRFLSTWRASPTRLLTLARPDVGKTMSTSYCGRRSLAP